METEDEPRYERKRKMAASKAASKIVALATGHMDGRAIRQLNLDPGNRASELRSTHVPISACRVQPAAMASAARHPLEKFIVDMISAVHTAQDCDFDQEVARVINTLVHPSGSYITASASSSEQQLSVSRATIKEVIRQYPHCLENPVNTHHSITKQKRTSVEAHHDCGAASEMHVWKYEF